ncbi:hypothetical protein T05_13630 [Trichinella murrelli]|uniref:Uncharacterized protein n=1 Tax=Trichinella murrelli TaxID=144512 RepID=A0A0V0TH42_9BILA|nr:hypothetical protein T05_13630 [Trichinella murrelli]
MEFLPSKSVVGLKEGEKKKHSVVVVVFNDANPPRASFTRVEDGGSKSASEIFDTIHRRHFNEQL